jgi:hypothetical protein
MRNKGFLPRVFLLLVLMAALLALAACQDEEELEGAESTSGAEAQVTMQPASSATAPETMAKGPSEQPTEEPTEEAASDVEPALSEASATAATELEEYVSVTELFSAKVPAGWSTQEHVPGGGLIMANSGAALERYDSGSAIEPGDFVLNVGFLPLALLQEKDLSHLGFQFEASPEVFLQSLLPMFRIGNDPAGDVAGEAALVSVREGRDAGLLTVSYGGREGLILVFPAGDGVIALVSAEGYPGELDALEKIAYAVAAEVAFSGAQDALYGALYGG